MIKQLPDAPYIRDAEVNGMPEAEHYYCPICDGEDPETFYVLDGQIVGCDMCTASVDAWDWHCSHRDD